MEFIIALRIQEYINNNVPENLHKDIYTSIIEYINATPEEQKKIREDDSKRLIGYGIIDAWKNTWEEEKRSNLEKEGYELHLKYVKSIKEILEGEQPTRVPFRVAEMGERLLEIGISLSNIRRAFIKEFYVEYVKMREKLGLNV